jgi:hypothetical protein
MRYSPVVTPVLFAVVMLHGALLTGCGGSEILSHRVPQGSLVESNPSSWTGITPLGQSKNYYLSIANDTDAVYIRVAVRQESIQRQLIRSGLVLWVDSKGGSSKKFGIRYPLGRANLAPVEIASDRMRDVGPDRPRASGPIGGLEMEILGSDDTVKERLLISQGEGIRVNVSREAEDLVYSARVPFSRFPELAQALRSGGDHRVGLGIEIASAPFPGRSSGDRTMEPGSGEGDADSPGGETMGQPTDHGDLSTGGRSGGRRGGMGQRAGGGGFRSDSISDWYEVLLNK